MRRLITVLVLLVLLAVVADRLSWFVAQRRLAAGIRQSAQLRTDPGVTIKGFPFLTQAAAGRYQEIDVSAVGLQAAAGLQVSRLDIALTGVHAPAEQVLSGTLNHLTTDRVVATGLVTFDELNAAAAARLNQRLTVTFGPGSNDRLSFKGSFSGGLLGEITISGDARLKVSDGQLYVSVLPDSLSGIPAVVSRQVADLLGVSYQLPPLPFGVRPGQVSVGADGVTVSASGTNVDLTLAGT